MYNVYISICIHMLAVGVEATDFDVVARLHQDTSRRPAPRGPCLENGVRQLRTTATRLYISIAFMEYEI